MDRIFALFARFFWVALGFTLASYAAGGFLALTTGVWRNFVGLDHTYLAVDQTVISAFEIVLVVGVTGSLLGRAFLLPALVAIVVAEIFRLRGALSHLLGGILVAFIAGYAEQIVPNVHGGIRRGWEVLLATGVVAGGVYWLIAGMRSGAWQDVGRKPQPATPADKDAPERDDRPGA